MSKPEQVGWCDKSGEILSMTGRAKWLRMNDNLRATAERFNEPLIRLSDYQRLQADHERLQAARAADTARIAELENSAASALAVAEGGTQSHNMQVIGRILREALAQQGKEGET